MNATEQTGERRKPNRRERDRAIAIDALRHLAELWPGLFALDPRRPLKIGIRYDIMAALGPSSPLKPYMVGAALRLHCGSPAYLKACRAGAAIRPRRPTGWGRYAR